MFWERHPSPSVPSSSAACSKTGLGSPKTDRHIPLPPPKPETSAIAAYLINVRHPSKAMPSFTTSYLAETITTMPSPPSAEEALPLLSPVPRSSSPSASPALSPASRTKLQGRRYLSPETPLRPLDISPSTPESAYLDKAGSGYRGDQSASSTERNGLSEKALGKRPARGPVSDSRPSAIDADQEERGGPEAIGLGISTGKGKGKGKAKVVKGRNVTVMFANAGDGEGGNLELWIEDGENVAHVKDQVSPLKVIWIICYKFGTTPVSIVRQS